MKMVGILFVALVAGVVAATVSLGSGGSLWAAVVTYFAAGTVATFRAVRVGCNQRRFND